jgi:hypothetical protein
VVFVCRDIPAVLPYTLQRNEHVRIDVLSGKLSPRGLAIIDIIGSLFFLLPMVILVLVLSIPLVAESYRITEYSANAGGLLRWPVKALLPIGFTLLALQGISELIKRIAFLLGRIDDPNSKDKGPRLKKNSLPPSLPRKSRRQNNGMGHRQHGAPDVWCAGSIPAVWISGCICAGRQRHRLRPAGD